VDREGDSAGRILFAEKVGERCRSRTAVARVNEIWSKRICYNLTVVAHE
jgi:hypothetical protein